MLKKKTIVAGERVSYRLGAEKRKKGSALPPKQYGIVEKLDDKTKGLLHIKFDNGDQMQLIKSKVVHEDPGAGFQNSSSSSSDDSDSSSSGSGSSSGSSSSDSEEDDNEEKEEGSDGTGIGRGAGLDAHPTSRIRR